MRTCVSSLAWTLCVPLHALRGSTVIWLKVLSIFEPFFPCTTPIWAENSKYDNVNVVEKSPSQNLRGKLGLIMVVAKKLLSAACPLPITRFKSAHQKKRFCSPLHTTSGDQISSQCGFGGSLQRPSRPPFPFTWVYSGGACGDSAGPKFLLQVDLSTASDEHHQTSFLRGEEGLLLTAVFCQLSTVLDIVELLFQQRRTRRTTLTVPGPALGMAAGKKPSRERE